jgi:ATP-dependent Clp protease ATP-binding subunit ClpA
MSQSPTQPLPAKQPSARFDKFSKRAQSVLALAREEAARFNHNYIGTEHLLLGLIREREGLAGRVLTYLDIELEKVRQAVEITIGRGKQAPDGDIGLTPRARKVVELAVEEASNLGHQYIGTEHLLLGLVREGEGIAAGILVSLGTTMKQVRRETLRLLSGQGGLRSRIAELGQAKDNVVTCRVDARDLAAMDTLIEAGIRTTRSDAASWLIHAGIQAQADLFARVNATVEQIRRLRQEAQTMAQEHATDDTAPPPPPDAPAPDSAAETIDEGGPAL